MDTGVYSVIVMNYTDGVPPYTVRLQKIDYLKIVPYYARVLYFRAEVSVAQASPCPG